jgi:hypothetical protein
VPEPACGVPRPEKGLTVPEGGTGICMSSGLPGTRFSGRLGILMRFATLLYEEGMIYTGKYWTNGKE